jgi:hypothetical protein
LETKETNKLENYYPFFKKLLDDRSRTMDKLEVIEFYKNLFNSDNRFIHSKQFLVDLESTIKNFNLRLEISNINLQSQKNLNNSLNESNVVDDSLKLNENQVTSQNLLKNNIFQELKNIPVLSKDDYYSNLINTDDQMVFLSNVLPKKEELNKLVISFLNSHNGLMIFGVDINNNQLTGIKMDRKSRDFFRQTFNSEYKNYLIDYEGCIKYKFYDLEDFSKARTDNLCILVIKLKKIKENKLIFDPNNKSFVIKDKFIKKYLANKYEKIKTSDIKQLNMKEYVEIVRNKFMKYYREKI